MIPTSDFLSASPIAAKPLARKHPIQNQMLGTFQRHPSAGLDKAYACRACGSRRSPNFLSPLLTQMVAP